MKDWRDRDDSSPYGSGKSIRREFAILAAIVAFGILTNLWAWMR